MNAGRTVGLPSVLQGGHQVTKVDLFIFLNFYMDLQNLLHPPHGHHAWY